MLCVSIRVAQGAVMKIVTLNLRHDVDRWTERLPMVVEALAQEDADVIAFQEVAFTSPQAQQIARCLKNQGMAYAVFTAPKWGVAPKEGIGMFSRVPVKEYEHINLPHGGRIAQRMCLHWQNRIVNVANVHLHHRPRGDESIRLQQLQALVDWMFSRDLHHWILAGDFNAQPSSETIQTVTQWFCSAHGELHGYEPVTHPTPLNPEREPGQQLSIDYVFYNASTFCPMDAHRFAHSPHPNDNTLFPSDHYGVSASFDFCDENKSIR